MVDFEAELPASARVEPGWDTLPGSLPGRFVARGSLDMLVRVAVLFDSDFWGIDELAWRRADGQGRGPGVLKHDPRQGGFF